MALDLLSIHPAKYKEVPFLCSKVTTTGGVKDVVHQYPGADTQNIEHIGKLPRKFSVTAVIAGSRYRDDKNSLLVALEDGQEGVFSHPWFGDVERIKCRNFTLDEDFTAFGEAKFTINFEFSDHNGIPEAVENSESTLLEDAEAANKSILETLAEGFSITDDLIGSIEAGTDKVLDMVGQVEAAMQPIRDITEVSNKLTESINDIENAVFDLVRTPVALSESIGVLFETAGQVSETPEQMGDAMTDLFEYGDDDPIKNTVPITPSGQPVQTTTENIAAQSNPNSTNAVTQEILNNSTTINETANSLSLVLVVVSYGQADYETIEAIEAKELLVEEQYEKIINGVENTPTKDQQLVQPVNPNYPAVIKAPYTLAPASGSSGGVYSSGRNNTDLIDKLTDLIVTFKTIMNHKKETALTVTQFEAPLMPSRVLAYQLYADSIRGETLLAMNKWRNAAYLHGPIDVLVSH